MTLFQVYKFASPFSCTTCLVSCLPLEPRLPPIHARTYLGCYLEASRTYVLLFIHLVRSLTINYEYKYSTSSYSTSRMMEVASSFVHGKCLRDIYADSIRSVH